MKSKQIIRVQIYSALEQVRFNGPSIPQATLESIRLSREVMGLPQRTNFTDTCTVQTASELLC